MEQCKDDQERKHLEEILDLAAQQLEASKERCKKKEEDILETKREQRENTVHQVGNLYSSDDFEGLIEMNQYASDVALQIQDYEYEEERGTRLEKVLKSPYFARIDFQFEGDEAAEKIYIGRFTLTGEKDYDIRVFDWRSPVASIFYRYGMGPAQYEAPVGIISGNVSVKRQYEIKDGRLEYFFDSEMEIMDEFLKQLLAQNASKSMHAIVETIQKDQDVIIRDLKSDLMMVQGMAGSGKTSVALHRAAFLMYQGLSGKLQADNIMILSPNSLFEQYISRVLPELGEENVVSYIFEEIMELCIQSKRIQSYRKFLEILAEKQNKDERIEKSFSYKTSAEFITVMKKYASTHSEQKNGRAAYLSLLEKMKDKDGIFSYTKENMASRTLFYEDALCICFLQLLLRGSKEDGRTIRHVIVDEVQDYTALHIEILKLMYPQANYTVLGDINQSIGRTVTMDFYEEINRILDCPKSMLVTMNKSFRCTRQILEFSTAFLDDIPEVESFCRDGEEPCVYWAETKHVQEKQIIEEVKLCLKQDYDSVALICDNQKAADNLYHHLTKQPDVDFSVSVVKDDSESPKTKVFTIPLYMAKGLEFDGVLAINIEKKRHLYIAATRALHRLAVFMEGEEPV